MLCFYLQIALSSSHISRKNKAPTSSGSADITIGTIKNNPSCNNNLFISNPLHYLCENTVACAAVIATEFLNSAPSA